MIKYLLLFMVVLVFISGCQSNSYVLPEIPNPQDNPEAFACSQDSDCVLQQTSCNNCKCPIAINVNYQVSLDCNREKPINVECGLYCFPAAPVCVDRMCVAVQQYPNQK